MKIIGLGRLYAFGQRWPDAKNWINNWVADTKKAQWASSQNVKQRYASASFLADNVVIFNIRGNNYRLETAVAYQTATVAVIWVGTHVEYTRRHK